MADIAVLHIIFDRDTKQFQVTKYGATGQEALTIVQSVAYKLASDLAQERVNGHHGDAGENSHDAESDHELAGDNRE